MRKIIPDTFVYHKSRIKNRCSIFKTGLIAQVGRSYSSRLKYNKEIKPAVFVNNIDINSNLYCKNIDLDIWKINTLLINNEFFIDENMGAKNKDYLITFENIPTHAIELIHKGKY